MCLKGEEFREHKNKYGEKAVLSQKVKECSHLFVIFCWKSVQSKKSIYKKMEERVEE